MSTSAMATFACPRCKAPLPVKAFEPDGVTCTGCGRRVEGFQFSALTRRDESVANEPVVGEEASCYFHENRVAMFACVRCGRFLCALCRVAWPGEDVCTACLEAVRKTEDDQFASSRFHFDSAALALSTVPIFTFFFSMFTAPLAMGFAVFTLRRECSIAPRSKLRFVLAILFSAATIAAWVLFWVYVGLRTPRAQLGSTP